MAWKQWLEIFGVALFVAEMAPGAYLFWLVWLDRRERASSEVSSMQKRRA